MLANPTCQWLVQCRTLLTDSVSDNDGTSAIRLIVDCGGYMYGLVLDVVGNGGISDGDGMST